MTEHSRLDRAKAKPVVAKAMGYEADTWSMEVADVLDAIRTCVLPDPRIARIEALCAQAERDGYWADAYMTQALRTALNGGDA